MNSALPIDFDNSYARLPEHFFARLDPEAASRPGLVAVNRELAQLLRIDPDWLASAEGIAMVAGNQLPGGAEPLAMAYAGHQFGGWNPQLGDGRALLLGEVIGEDGERYDIQLKGSGRTPWSRGGDGRAPLGPVLREYLLSEAMAVLGVPTTRALAAVTTGDPVYREGALPGAVLARVARSHIRIGTFQYFAARKDMDALQLLTDHAIQRHYPAAAQAPNPALALLEGVIQRQAELVARWQLLGFIHGVMNTDNMLISGDTIDYGPCAFMDGFDANKVFSSIDHGGRYAYRNQPGIAQWNLANLAQVLLPLIDEDSDAAVSAAQAAIDSFSDRFLEAHNRGMAAKLGLAELRAEDEQLVEELLALLQESGADFTLFYRHLADLACADSGSATVADLFTLPDSFAPWLERWQARLSAEDGEALQRQQQMYRANPIFIPRNHLVEAAINAAVRDDDLDNFQQLGEVLAEPFVYRPELASYALPPQPQEVVHQTFCGT